MILAYDNLESSILLFMQIVGRCIIDLLKIRTE